jgi:hypothetical protein
VLAGNVACNLNFITMKRSYLREEAVVVLPDGSIGTLGALIQWDRK